MRIERPIAKLLYAAVSIAICTSPVTAVAASSSVQTVQPLIAVSVYGTQASAQAVCTNMASSAATAGAAAAAQGQTGCVLPAVDRAPPPVTEAPVAPLPPTGNFGVNWLLAGLGALILVGAILAATSDDDDDGRTISPA